MMQGRNTYLTKSLIGSLPLPQSTQYHPCLTHLKLEAEMVSIFAPILHDVSLAEVEMIEHVPDIQRLLDQWPPMAARMEHWNPKLKHSHGEPLSLLFISPSYDAVHWKTVRAFPDYAVTSVDHCLPPAGIVHERRSLRLYH